MWLKLKNINFTAINAPFFLEDLDIENVWVSNKISFGEKATIDTLLVTCIMIIKLSLYI